MDRVVQPVHENDVFLGIVALDHRARTMMAAARPSRGMRMRVAFNHTQVHLVLGYIQFNKSCMPSSGKSAGV